MRHIVSEREQQEFSFEEVQELEGDLGKIHRRLSEARERDVWDVAAREEVQRLTEEAEENLAAFTQETYDRLQGSGSGNGSPL